MGRQKKRQNCQQGYSFYLFQFKEKKRLSISSNSFANVVTCNKVFHLENIKKAGAIVRVFLGLCRWTQYVCLLFVACVKECQWVERTTIRVYQKLAFKKVTVTASYFQLYFRTELSRPFSMWFGTDASQHKFFHVWY